MVEGAYAVSAKTPLGLKQGTLRLVRGVEGDAAALDVPGVRVTLSTVELDEESGVFRLAGAIRHLLGSVPFACEGRVEGDVLTARGESPVGAISITGRRSAR